jgi:hypothetical protein
MAMSTRRNLIKIATAGGVSGALGLTIKPGTEARAVAGPQHDHGKPISGPLAQATVSFGQSSTSPSLDRLLVNNREIETFTSSYLTKSQSRQVEP